MFPWMNMGGGMGSPTGTLSLYQMLMQDPYYGNMMRNRDRSDQGPYGNKTDPGNAMNPAGRSGGPSLAGMNPYDPTVVRPSDDPRERQQRLARAMSMGQLGLSMLQPR